MLAELVGNVGALLFGIVVFVAAMALFMVAGAVMVVGVEWLESATPEVAKDGLAIAAAVVCLAGFLLFSWELGTMAIDWLSRVKLP